MKVACIENVRIPSERAHAYQIVQTCAWLARFGYDVTLVNPDRAGGKDVLAEYGLSPGLFRHERLRSWDPLTRWPVAKPLAYVLQRWAFVRELRRWVRGNASDVWYTRDPAIVDALRSTIRGPWVLELHDAPDANPARWARVRPFVSRFVVISSGLKRRLLNEGIGEDRIVVAPDAFDPEFFV
jgi:hypothetical protein